MASPVKTSNVSFALHSDSNNEGALKTKVKKDGNQLDHYIWTTNFNALIFLCTVQKFPFKSEKKDRNVQCLHKKFWAKLYYTSNHMICLDLVWIALQRPKIVWIDPN